MTQPFSDTETEALYMGLPELARRLGVDVRELTDDLTDHIRPGTQGLEETRVFDTLTKIVRSSPVLAGLSAGFLTALVSHHTTGPALLAVPPALDASSLSPASSQGFVGRLAGYMGGVAVSYCPQVADTAYQLLTTLGPSNGM